MSKTQTEALTNQFPTDEVDSEICELSTHG